MRATILGGRYDGFEVDWVGRHVTFHGERYVGVFGRTNGREVYVYLLASLDLSFFVKGRV